MKGQQANASAKSKEVQHYPQVNSHINAPCNITQKEAFLKYLQRMDIEMIELILDDSITYFGASKKVFLQKLSYIFNQVKLGGEKGNLRIKQHKKRANTYYLLLKIFDYSNKFVIEEKEGNIIKIYDTKIKVSKEDIEGICQLDLFFGDDEKADFKPSNEYVMNLYRCTNAYEELVNGKIQILTSEDISQWLKKHSLLYEEVKEDYLFFKYNDFRNLFFEFEYLWESLQSYNEVKVALKSFTDTDTASLHQWLVDYYELAFCRVLSFDFNCSDIDVANKTLYYHPNFYFKGDDFLSIVEFCKLYKKHYDNYRTFKS